MSLIMMRFGHKTAISFQMVRMTEVPIEASVEENGRSLLKAIQAIPAIRDHIHDKLAKSIK